MSRLPPRIVLALLATAALAGPAALVMGASATAAVPAPEAAPANGFLVLSRFQTGYIGLGAFGQRVGAVVRFEEIVDGRAVLIRTARAGAEPIRLFRAVSWRCDRTVRHFRATVTAPGDAPRTAIADMHTPGCADRVGLVVPSHVRAGARLRVRVVDRWRLGDRDVTLCAAGAVVRAACRKVHLAPGAQGTVRTLRVRPRGRVRIRVRIDGRETATARTVAVGPTRAAPPPPLPVLLTTGDSTIDGVDSLLDGAFARRARVRSQTRPGTRLSGGGAAAWIARAEGQVARLRPRVTVVSLGANEGYDLRDAATGARHVCCGPEWIAELAVRQRRLMRIYAQGGRGAVVWVVLPVPRSPARAAVQAAVDAATTRAAAAVPSVHLADQRPLFTPDGRFHERLTIGGRLLRVRAPDGIHLSADGQRVAAAAIAAQIRRARLLGR